MGRVRRLQWRYQRARLSFNIDHYDALLTGPVHPIETAKISISKRSPFSILIEPQELQICNISIHLLHLCLLSLL